jgi:hypothetical protein
VLHLDQLAELVVVLGIEEVDVHLPAAALALFLGDVAGAAGEDVSCAGGLVEVPALASRQTLVVLQPETPEDLRALLAERPDEEADRSDDVAVAGPPGDLGIGVDGIEPSQCLGELTDLGRLDGEGESRAGQGGAGHSVLGKQVLGHLAGGGSR